MNLRPISRARRLCAAVCCLNGLLLCGRLDSSREQDSEPIDVGTQKQLFVDGYIVQSMDRSFRILNQPVKHLGSPVLALQPPQTVGGNELVIVSGSVIYDDEERLFKMWYEAADYHWNNNMLWYATSKDGIRWTLPALGLIEHRGSKANNAVYRSDRPVRHLSPGVFKDPVANDSQQKYKMIHTRGDKIADGVRIAFSPDGVHWTSGPDRPITAASDSPNSVLWDPKLRRYTAHTRHNETRHGVFTRVVLLSESDDFMNWITYDVIMKPDDRDPPWDRQFYNMEWMPYEDVFFGFVSVYHTLPGMENKITRGVHWMDKVDIQLTFSRDGRKWSRAGSRQVFIPNSHSRDDFDWGMMYVMQHPVVVKDEIWIYYVGFGGLRWATKRNELQGGAVGLARLRLDGFVSVDAGDGTITTKLMRMSGDRLIVNADASLGSVRVEILGPDGKPVPGFSKDEADPITSDSVRHTARWRGSSHLSSHKDMSLALKFYLDRSKLYSFGFQPAG